ncbi:hypothetical protein [Rhizobium leguminosarum]|uniref:hypothetical protein n=1 Tax=Rhizobium leguminosarum TaxID=384 RepID=UPI001C96AF25|nr:hypothetical protein [Rhizobium leguminosarum]MBY5796384.1 hypothetical protein [Rhizobium leguminosarum]
MPSNFKNDQFGQSKQNSSRGNDRLEREAEARNGCTRPKAAITLVLFSAQSEIEPHGKETGKLGEQQKYKATSPPRLSKNHHAYERHQKVGRCKD